jgi:hypothetical protein
MLPLHFPCLAIEDVLKRWLNYRVTRLSDFRLFGDCFF